MATRRTPGTLVGREAECARVADALADDRVVLVTGEPGIGKSTVARAAVAAGGRRLHAGAGFATLADMPYVALRQALREPVAGDPVVVAGRVEAVVGDGVLLLDDLQWVDRATAAVLPLLAGRMPLILTSRDPAAAVAGIPDDTMVRIRLGPLGPADAESLARASGAALTDAGLRRVLARAGGNPLLIAELTRDDRPSPSVERAFARHLDEASPAARRALALLAVAERPLPATALAATEAELLDLGLAVRIGDALAVRHALFADAVLGRTDPAELTALHGEAAQLVTDPAARVLHLARAGRGEDAVDAALASLDAASDARDRIVMLRIAADVTPGGAGLAYRIRAARLAMDLTDAALAVELLSVPLDGPPEAVAYAEAVLAAALTWLGRHEEARAATERARALALDPLGEAAHRLAMDAAIDTANAGDPATALVMLDRAAPALPHVSASSRTAHENLRATFTVLSGGAARIDDLRSGFAEAVAVGLPSTASIAPNVMNIILAVEGPGAADAFASDAIPALRAVGLESARLAGERIQLLVFLGRASEAVILADELLERPAPGQFRGWVQVQRAEALCHLGLLGEAEASIDAARPALADDWTDLGEARTVGAGIAFWSGRLRDAIADAEAALVTPVHYQGNYLLPAIVRAWSQVELGVAPDPLPDAPGSWLRDAAGLEWAALAALARGDEAAAAFDAAAASWGDHHVFRRVVCRWAAGEAARRAGSNDAEARLRDALAEAEERGYAAVAARVRRSLRLAGARVPVERGRDGGAGLLTPREREVLRLVADGHANIEIARRIGLGRPTVTRILSNAMAKLGAESRAQAVTLAERLP